MLRTLLLIVHLGVPAQTEAPQPVPLTAEEAAARVVQAAPEVRAAQAAALVAESATKQVNQALYPRLDLTARFAHVDGFPDGSISVDNSAIDFDAARQTAAMVSDPAARALLSGLVEQQAQASELTLVIPRNQARFMAQLSYPITRVLFGVLPQADSADARQRAEEHRADAARAEVILRAKESFYRYAEARAAVRVAQAGQERAEEQRQRVAALVAAGLATVADGAVSEARASEAAEGLTRAQGAERIALSVLSLLLADGELIQYNPRLPETPQVLPGSIDALETSAVEHRPELLALEASTEGIQLQRDSTLASSLPSLGVFAGAEVSNPNPRVVPPIQEWNPSWEVGAQLTWSPNDLARSTRQSGQLEAEAARVTAERDALVRAIRLEVRRAHNEWQVALDALATAHARLRASQEAYRARSLEYDNGQAILTDVLEADAALRRAELGRLRADIEARVASARLDRAIGRDG